MMNCNLTGVITCYPNVELRWLIGIHIFISLERQTFYSNSVLLKKFQFAIEYLVRYH